MSFLNFKTINTDKQTDGRTICQAQAKKLYFSSTYFAFHTNNIQLIRFLYFLSSRLLLVQINSLKIWTDDLLKKIARKFPTKSANLKQAFFCIYFKGIYYSWMLVLQRVKTSRYLKKS